MEKAIKDIDQIDRTKCREIGIQKFNQTSWQKISRAILNSY